jgi:hypothetical protein
METKQMRTTYKIRTTAAKEQYRNPTDPFTFWRTVSRLTQGVDALTDYGSNAPRVWRLF